MNLSREQIKERESIETPLDEAEKYDTEIWLVSYEEYEDHLGLKNRAWMVHDRLIVHVTAKTDQYEYYGNRFYDSGRIGFSDDGRKWRYRAELVSYTGGGSWRILEDIPAPTGFKRDNPGGSFWRTVPYSEKGKDPIGYMFPDGTRATKLLKGGSE